MSANPRIIAELRGEVGQAYHRARRVASYSAEWATVGEACRIMSCDRASLYKGRCEGQFVAIDERAASENTENAQGVGLLLKRSDCLRVAAIRKRCRVSLVAACRIYAAIKLEGPL